MSHAIIIIKKGEPLIKREKKAKEMRPIIHFTQSLWNPMTIIISLMNFQLNLSKDLDISSLIRIPEVLETFRE
jgi:hypothetical protein